MGKKKDSQAARQAEQAGKAAERKEKALARKREAMQRHGVRQIIISHIDNIRCMTNDQLS